MILRWTISTFGLAALGFALLVGVRRIRVRSGFHTLSVVTPLSVGLVTLVYSWGFERGTCGSLADVACRLNANEGVLAATAIVLALGGFWIAQSDNVRSARLREAELLEETRGVVRSAVRETLHNLNHIANAYSPTLGLIAYPSLSHNAVQKLSSARYQKLLAAPTLIQDVDAYLRNAVDLATKFSAQDQVRTLVNLDVFARFDPLNIGKEEGGEDGTNPAVFGHGGLLVPGEGEEFRNIRGLIASLWEGGMSGLVFNSLRFLIDVCIERPTWVADLYEVDGLQGMRSLISRLRNPPEGVELVKPFRSEIFRARYYIGEYGSISPALAANLRKTQTPLVCWTIDGEPHENVETFAFWLPFRDGVSSVSGNP